MKFFKFTKNNIPPLSKVRPAIFDVDHAWFVALGVFVAIVIVTIAIGFKLFYYGYFESYKKEVPQEDFKSLIDTNKLKNIINQRNEFLSKETSLPRDPSVGNFIQTSAPPAGIEPTSTP